jgi:hypothetical protein
MISTVLKTVSAVVVLLAVGIGTIGRVQPTLFLKVGIMTSKHGEGDGRCCFMSCFSHCLCVCLRCVSMLCGGGQMII